MPSASRSLEHDEAGTGTPTGEEGFMLIVLYAVVCVLLIAGLTTTIWVSLVVGSLLALFVGFAWVTK